MTAAQALQRIAHAYGLPPARLAQLHSTEPHTSYHCLGLWNCQDNGFYRFVFCRVRSLEGPAWLTNSRTPAQLLLWWADYQDLHHDNSNPTHQPRCTPRP